MTQLHLVLIGGAGFVGTHLSDRLVPAGHRVTVFDPCLPPAHPSGPPRWLQPEVELVAADPRDASDRFIAAASAADAVIHLGALTGTGQSLYEVSAYTDTNLGVTSWLAELLVKRAIVPGRVVFASTRAVYGDGPGVCEACGRVSLLGRTREALASHRWNPLCGSCGREAAVVPVREGDPLDPRSPYAMTKMWAEQVLSYAADVTGTPLTTLRFFNLFGPRQLASNPYVGVVSAFGRAVLRGTPIELYEDGKIARDFLYVADACAAIEAALGPVPASGTFNVGSGRSTTLRDLAELLAVAADRPDLPIEASGRARVGDPRSVVADSTKAAEVLRWRPTTAFIDGLARTLAFLAVEDEPRPGSTTDDLAVAARHLVECGLLIDSGPRVTR